MRSHSATLATLLFLATAAPGCSTTGGKVFGTATVLSSIGSIYLFSTSDTMIEHGQITGTDHRDAAAGLMFAAVGAVAGWFVSEYVIGSPWGRVAGGGGGGGGAPGGMPPALEPVPVVEPVAAPGPVVVVAAPDDPRRAGWRLDPQDGQDKLYNTDAELVLRIDRAGAVWNIYGATFGQVDMSGNCDVACRRAQAHEMLRRYNTTHVDPRRPGGR